MERRATVLASASAAVFLLELDGLLAVEPSATMVEKRTRLRAARFAPSTAKEKRK